MDDREVEKYTASKLARLEIAEPRFRPQDCRGSYFGSAYNHAMSAKYLDDRAKELGQGKNVFCRGEIAKALREVKYRHDHEMYGAASKAIEDLEFLVSRIPAGNPKPDLKQGPPHKRGSK